MPCMGLSAFRLTIAALPLNLDFIYGSVEARWSDALSAIGRPAAPDDLVPAPLVSRLAGRLLGGSSSELLCPNDNSRFSYAVRPSSTEFYNELVKFQPKGSPDSFESMSRLVTRPVVVFPLLAARSDNSVLVEDAGRDPSAFPLFQATSITGSLILERPAITFQLLDLENFGLSDDLYIKMNDRGKPLTAFETFKARYEQELEIQFKGKTRSFGDESFSVAEFFSRRMDTTWADFFWTHRDTETNLYDEAVMNLF